MWPNPQETVFLFIYLFIYHSIKKNGNKVATLAAMGHGYL